MIILAVVGALAIGLAPQQIDTTFAVRPGGRLEMDVTHGTAVVNTWDRDAIRIRNRDGDLSRLRVRQSGGTVELDERRSRGTTGGTYEITVPRSFNIEIVGVNLSVTIDGVQGDVAVETMQGAVTVRGVTGNIEIETVNGAVAAENTRGRIEVSSTNQNVRMSDVRGDIEVETTNGSITILRADANNVQARTINGIVQYDGTVRDGGRYYLGTHNGTIVMSFPERANAAVSVSTNSGQVQSTFGVPITSVRDRRFNFTLGSGSARVELVSFNGSVRLVRPGGR